MRDTGQPGNHCRRPGAAVENWDGQDEEADADMNLPVVVYEATQRPTQLILNNRDISYSD
jgi:hypothetical protein